ncbi:hypothetical protein B0H16DRAFT_1744214 [Mycena metata]|uniref:Uncharacterized protein n=1 Tax=Mycena metata TaxID=1033252 RepID=A0AAD7H4V7_9AGAR|nr:hypothetical protein B0H16DRAFT_1744214 [Mycena metata]
MAQVKANLRLFSSEFAELAEGSGTAHVSAGCWLSDDNEDFFESKEDGNVSNAVSIPTMEDLLATANDTSDTESYEYTPSDLDGVEYFLQLLQESDSDSDHESMPDLQAVSDSDSNCDSMPDLQCASDSDDEEDGERDAECSPNFSAYNSSDCECDIPRTTSVYGPDRPPPSFEDDHSDIADWVEISVNEWLSNQMDTEEEKITLSFDTAMLANTAGTPNIETELYDSGASHHMSPH